MPIIETKNLTKYYGKSRGIINLNLNLDEGDFFGLIGPNGAGKSTLIRLLLGLIYPTEGSANVLGLPLSRSVDYLSDVGYLASESNFYSGMRAGEVISYSAKLHHKDCSDEAEMLCKRLDLDTKKRVEDLSLGNRKKVGIVCALQHNPKLYILDEPTSGLDPLVQKEFFTMLKEKQEKGATILFSSHVLSEVQRHCNRAAILREGKLAAVDKMENLSRSNTKKVTLHGTNHLPSELPVNPISKGEDSVTFLYRGEVQELLSALCRLNINDITISDPELDEIFLHYYEKERNL